MVKLKTLLNSVSLPSWTLQAAERVLNACTIENRMKVKFVGNAPVGVYKYKYPEDIQHKIGAQGAKVRSHLTRS